MGENLEEPGAEPRERSMEELLDNTPEAVAMRRARAARAEKAAREAVAARAPGATRRRLILGGVLGAATAARVLGRIAASRRRR